MNEFTGFTVENYDENGNIDKTITVPIQLGHDEKFFQVIKRDQTEIKDYYKKLPKMSLSWDGITFNGERLKGAYAQRQFIDSDGNKIDDLTNFITNVSPVPYDFTFTLELRTVSLNHFTQLMERILVGFEPTRYLRVKEFSFLNVERNLKVRLDGISPDFLTEQTVDQVRHCNATLTMVVEGWLYKELTSTDIIKQINSRYMIGTDTVVDEFSVSGFDDETNYPTSGFTLSGDALDYLWFKN